MADGRWPMADGRCPLYLFDTARASGDGLVFSHSGASTKVLPTVAGGTTDSSACEGRWAMAASPRLPVDWRPFQLAGAPSLSARGGVLLRVYPPIGAASAPAAVLEPSRGSGVAAAVVQATRHLECLGSEGAAAYRELVGRFADAQLGGLHLDHLTSRRACGAPAPDAGTPHAARVMAAQRAVLACATDGELPSAADLCAAHAMLVPGGGALRARSVRVGTTRFAVPASAVPQLLDELLDALRTISLRDDLSAVAKAAWAGYSLLALHPFPDGNGRLARCLVNAVLARHGTPFAVALAASTPQRDAYRAALVEAHRAASSRPFAAHVGACVAAAWAALAARAAGSGAAAPGAAPLPGPQGNLPLTIALRGGGKRAREDDEFHNDDTASDDTAGGDSTVDDGEGSAGSRRGSPVDDSTEEDDSTVDDTASSSSATGSHASDGGRATDEEDGAEVYHGYQGTDAGTTTPALEAYLHRDVVRGRTGADWRRRPLGRLGWGARRALLRTMSILLREALCAVNAARMSELQRAQLQGLLRPDVTVAWRTEAEEKDLGFLLNLVSEARGMPPKWAPGKGLLA